MANGIIYPGNCVFSAQHDDNVNIAKNGSSDFGLSLSLPSGKYMVIVQIFFQKTGSESNAYGKLHIKVGNESYTGDSATPCQASGGNNQQVPMQRIRIIDLSETTTVTPLFFSNSSASIVYSSQYMFAIRLS